MTDLEKQARQVVEKWLWDCGEGNQVLGFVQSELLQQRIVEALSSSETAEEAMRRMDYIAAEDHQQKLAAVSYAVSSQEHS